MNCRFMYTFLGLGITLCVITCTGHVAAETANGCCLYLVSFFLNQLNWNWWSYTHYPLYVTYTWISIQESFLLLVTRLYFSL